jgi:NitT/TauT family transport system substrate-binding protein
MSLMTRAWLKVVVLLGALLPGSLRAEEIVVSLWKVGLVGAPEAVAIEKGYFKEAGVDVTGVMGGGGGGNVVRNMFANEGLPFGLVALPAAIAAQKQGLPIVVVNSGVLASDNVWVTMPNSGINSLSDLIGKRIAYTSPKSISEAYLLMALKTKNIDPSKVTLIAAGGIGAGLTLIENGGADAALITEPTNTLRKGKYKVVFSIKDTLPPLSSIVGVTTRDFAKKHPEKIRALLKARQRAVEFIYNNPEEAGRIVARAFDMKPEVMIEAIGNLARDRYWLAGDFDINLLTNLAAGMRLTGELQGEVDWASLIDPSMLPQDLQQKSKLR